MKRMVIAAVAGLSLKALLELDEIEKLAGQ